jgi:hypothetical protein
MLLRCPAADGQFEMELGWSSAKILAIIAARNVNRDTYSFCRRESLFATWIQLPPKK